MEDFDNTKLIYQFCNKKHIFCKKCFQEYVNKIKNNYNDVSANILLPKGAKNDPLPCPYCRNNINAEYLYAIYNKKEGLNISYHKNGKVYEEIYYKDGHIGDGPYKKYYDNGALQIQYIYKNNRINGLYEEFWYNGNLKRKSYYENGFIHGLSKIYYENGNIQEESYLVNDIFEGSTKKYYSNGILKESLIYANNLKNGLYEEFDKNGILIKREFYKNNVKVENISLE